jgi:hypothetical protein
MPSCVLRVAGADIEPEQFAAMFPTAVIPLRGGGLNIVIGDCDGDDIAGQIRDAEAFLVAHASAIAKLLAWPGVRASLDFGVWRKDIPIQQTRLPASLAALAGGLGLEIELSMYAAD